MKIGVALSGCDIGGISAWTVLRELEAQGFEIGMISACCVPAAAALLYARGCSDKNMRKLSKRFLRDVRESDADAAIANLAEHMRPGEGKKIPLAINAVNIADGSTVTFTDDYSLEGGNIRTFGIEDPYDVLSSTISLMGGLGSYRYGSLRLCDFCCRYGCPVPPLRLEGLRKVVSVAFLPGSPAAPYEVLVKRMVAGSASSADVHIPIEFGSEDLSFDQYAQIAAEKIKSSTDKILLETLF